MPFEITTIAHPPLSPSYFICCAVKGCIDFVLNQDDSKVKHIFTASEAFKYEEVMRQCLLKVRG